MKYTKEFLGELARNSGCMAELMRKAGISVISGGMHAHLKKKLVEFDIDTSHWTSTNKGKILPRRQAETILKPVDGAYKEKSTILLRAMLESGIEYRCRRCSVNSWNGEFIRLQIEHKDGDTMNNTIENLELLCPNCHSQSKTYAMPKSAKAKSTAQALVEKFGRVVK